MRYSQWKRFARLALAGSFLLATPACSDLSQAVVSVSSIATAGGLFYLINKILE